jgi:hypothetical protein
MSDNPEKFENKNNVEHTLEKIKKENSLEKYSYIADWISATMSVVAVIGAIIGLVVLYPTLKLLLTGKTTVVYTFTSCQIKKTDDFNNFLIHECNNLLIGTSTNISKEMISKYMESPERVSIEAKINRQTLEICQTDIRCSYSVVINDAITIHDCASVCVTRAKTNQTECSSTC